MSYELERPAALVSVLTPERAHSQTPTCKPLIEGVLASRASVVVLDRAAVLDETIVTQAATLHEAGLRVRSLSFFYDEWLGKLPVSELERMSLMFDVGELHRLQYGRIKRVCDVAVGLVGLRRSHASDDPGRRSRRPGRKPGSDPVPPGPGGQSGEGIRHPQVPNHATGDRGDRMDGRRGPARHPIRADTPTHPHRRAAAGDQYSSR